MAHFPHNEYDDDIDVDDDGTRMLAVNELLATYLRLGSAQDPSKVRNYVGAHADEWSVYDQPAGKTDTWSTASMFVIAYLHHSPDDTDGLTMSPPGLRATPDGAIRSLHHLQRALRMLCFRWRQQRVNKHLSDYIRALERSAVRLVLHAEVAEPTEEMRDVCCMLVRMWSAEYIMYHIVPSQRIRDASPPPDRDMLDNWISLAVEHCQTAKVNMARVLFGTLLPPGSNERYARANGGVLAATAKSVIEDIYTHVAVTRLSQATDRIDTRLACGICIVYLVSRAIHGDCKFIWAADNVAVDTELMSAKRMASVRFRTSPWITLVGGQWIVVQGQRCWSCADATTAVYVWFKRFKRYSPDGTILVGCDEFTIANTKIPFYTLN